MDLNKLNKFQTVIDEDLKKSLPKKVYDQMLEYLSTVKFLQHLIAPEEVRGFAKDRPKYSSLPDNDPKKTYDDDRIIVDLTKPHILKDMDFFREKALFFKENGKYTNITPNTNPRSEYAEFWKNELEKWKKGVVRPSDGEWIPGSLYFYWNYCQISLVKKIKNTKKGVRVKDFPRVYLGDYLFYHYCDQAQNEGKHGKLLKARGVGASFKFASMSPYNMYTKPGSGNANFHLASDKTFLLGDKGIWGKILDNLDWISETTPFSKMRLVDKKQAMELQLGFEDEYGSRKGLLTSVYGVSLKDNPDKARGIRGPLIHYEEDGLFPNLEKAWSVNREATEEDGVAYGFMFAAGTGGTSGASFEGSEKLFYQPDAFNIYGISNVFDKNTNENSKCGFFWGAYLNRGESVTKENGEPDVIQGLIDILLERKKISDSSSDPLAITQKKAEAPITPQEAVMRIEGTVFPVADLKDYLETIAVKKNSFLAEHLVGDLIASSNGDITWKLDPDKTPLRSYSMSQGDRTGAIEIFEMPRKNAEGVIQRGRYIAGCDPIDSDSGQSLFSILIMDTFTDRIVAEYSGRPRLASDAYETTLRLLKFYNAEANYESNLKGLFSYFSNKNALYLLADSPQILRDMELIKATNLYGNRSKGTIANARINIWGRELAAEWMMTPAYSDEEGILNMHKIRSIPLLEEAIAWNIDGNFDRISALGMLMILREDRKKRTQSAKNNQYQKRNHLSTDSFFEKNYSNKLKSYEQLDKNIKY